MLQLIGTDLLPTALPFGHVIEKINYHSIGLPAHLATHGSGRGENHGTTIDACPLTVLIYLIYVNGGEKHWRQGVVEGNVH